jgi:hypothetical protein
MSLMSDPPPTGRAAESDDEKFVCLESELNFFARFCQEETIRPLLACRSDHPRRREEEMDATSTRKSDRGPAQPVPQGGFSTAHPPRVLVAKFQRLTPVGFAWEAAPARRSGWVS